jgi:hydrogenase maturation protease
MTEKPARAKTLILGIGNIIISDEGFGVHVARRLKEIDLPDNLVVTEGGVGGFDLLGVLGGIRRVIVVDVMMIDSEPGEISLFKPGPEFIGNQKNIISFHQYGVLELVQMWELLDYKPEVFFLVTRPQNLTWGMELSTPVVAAVEKAVELVRDLCRENFARLERSQSIC